MVDLILAGFKYDCERLAMLRSARAEGLLRLLKASRCCLSHDCVALRVAVRRGQVEAALIYLTAIEEAIHQKRATYEAMVAASRRRRSHPFDSTALLYEVFESYGLAIKGGNLAMVKAFHEHSSLLSDFRMWADEENLSSIMQQALNPCAARGCDEVLCAVGRLSRPDQWWYVVDDLLSAAGQHDRLSTIDCLLVLIREHKAAVDIEKLLDPLLRALIHSAMAGAASTCCRLIDFLRQEGRGVTPSLLSKLNQAAMLLSTNRIGPHTFLNVTVLLLDWKPIFIDHTAYMAAAVSGNRAMVRLLRARAANPFAYWSACSEERSHGQNIIFSCFLQDGLAQLA